MANLSDTQIERLSLPLPIEVEDREVDLAGIQGHGQLSWSAIEASLGVRDFESEQDHAAALRTEALMAAHRRYVEPDKAAELLLYVLDQAPPLRSDDVAALERVWERLGGREGLQLHGVAAAR